MRLTRRCGHSEEADIPEFIEEHIEDRKKKERNKLCEGCIDKLNKKRNR